MAFCDETVVRTNSGSLFGHLMSENRPRNLVSFGIVYFVVVTVAVRRTTMPKTNSNIAMTNRLF